MTEWCYSDETDQIVCEICGQDRDVALRRIMFDGFSCSDCLYVWHEGAGVTAEAVRARSLERQAARALGLVVPK
jgi:ribosomal protein L37AE/L43A